MRKRKLKATLAVALVAAAGLCSYETYQDYKTDKESDLVMLNIEALTEDDGSSTVATGWIRANDDCVYTITGKAGSKVTLKIGSIGSVTLMCNAEGVATYVASDSQTDCTSGGKQKCQDRYCPVAIWSSDED